MYAHRAWAEQLGGLAFPLLADFHPKGAVARQFGVWREDRGVSKRAVFLIDRDGIIRWSKLYEQSLPDNNELLAALDAIARQEDR